MALNQNLTELLDSSPAAKQFFSSLPPFVRETMMMSNHSIKTEDELRKCAEQIAKS